MAHNDVDQSNTSVAGENKLLAYAAIAILIAVIAIVIASIFTGG